MFPKVNKEENGYNSADKKLPVQANQRQISINELANKAEQGNVNQIQLDHEENE